MPLVIAGIDEAGYGPLLGPLCVSMSVFRVEEWSPGEAAPNMWSLLTRGVCRKAADKAGRIAIDDSKKLKGPNDRVSRHPLTELERGVLAFFAHRVWELADGSATPEAEPTCRLPGTDVELFNGIGAACEPHEWYAGTPTSLPLGSTAEQMRIAANQLGVCLNEAGVSVLDMRCRAIGEAGFNRIVERTGTKSAATGAGVTRHLRSVWNQHAAVEETCEGGARVVCDAQGGRTDYHDYLSRAIPGSRVTTLEQSSARSRYVIEGELPCAIGGEVVMSGAESGEPDGECESASPRWERKPRAITITFMPEAETSHLPVALASMLAKLTRELMMHRFNRYWTGRMPDLKPTAGYTLDARRWLADVGDRVSRTERATLVRRA